MGRLDFSSRHCGGCERLCDGPVSTSTSGTDPRVRSWRISDLAEVSDVPRLSDVFGRSDAAAPETWEVSKASVIKLNSCSVFPLPSRRNTSWLSASRQLSPITSGNAGHTNRGAARYLRSGCKRCRKAAMFNRTAASLAFRTRPAGVSESSAVAVPVVATTSSNRG